MRTSTSVEKHSGSIGIYVDTILAAAIDDSCTNNDDGLILSLIEMADIDQVATKDAESAFMELARCGRTDPVLAIASTWMSKLSSNFRKSVMVSGLEQFSDNVFISLIASNIFQPSVQDMEAIFVETIPNRSLVILHAIIKHWSEFISFNAADYALLTAVSFDLLDKLDALVHSDLPITEKGAFDALSTAIEKRHFVIFEYLLSDSCPMNMIKMKSPSLG